jgi:sensor histidine kinase YesM
MFRPFPSTIINGILLNISVCFMAWIAWQWSYILFKRKIIVQIAGHLIGVVVSFIILASVSYFFEYYLDDFTSFEEWQEYLLEQLGVASMQYNLQYVTATTVYYIIRYIETIKQNEEDKTKLAIENNHMQMALLKSQINPHFLFNTLNSISTLMGVDKIKARNMMSMLSEVIRYALDSNDEPSISLSEEISFIRNYINIQQVRFGDRLKYEEKVEQECLGIELPPMVLQPLVENSVKHGISPKEDGGTITLAIYKKEDLVCFEINDDGVGINNNSQYETSNSGVGLKNSNERLINMFNYKSRLKTNATEKGYSVKFQIPWKIK